jgi:hypothetical protein
MRRFGLVLLALLLNSGGLRAQIASPGPLTRAHAELEGLRSCTRCHELRQKGASAARCLECHAPLAERVARGVGYHGRLRGRDCGACHKEHIGLGADIVRLDTAAFGHDSTGFVLRGSHAQTACRACHRPEYVSDALVRSYQEGRVLRRTFLGVARNCSGCHAEDSPHEAEVSRRGCEECHGESDWTDVAGFDHERTRYPLTGAHRSVDCGACHERQGKLRLRGIAFATCTDCHRDPHTGRFGARCVQCHGTGSWAEVAKGEVERRFDHARTGFVLREAHASLACAGCHERGRARRSGIRITFRAGDAGATYPRPQGSGCLACHVDFHAGAFRGAAAACDRCHGEGAWLPVRFGVTEHERSRYALAGVHRVVPCVACHVRAAGGGPPRMRWAELDCRGCHADDDPHQGRFGNRPCGSCHADGTFTLGAFDHAGLERGECRSCHRADDPHRGQFGERACAECHGTGSWRIERYEHEAFVLDGAHASLGCAACHAPGADGVRQFRSVPKTCSGCHGGVP